jgi:hypothetical protein
MTDGSRFVFDWWKSLDVSDPWIFRYDDFMDNHQENGVPYCEFRGWSP